MGIYGDQKKEFTHVSFSVQDLIGGCSLRIYFFYRKIVQICIKKVESRLQ